MPASMPGGLLPARPQPRETRLPTAVQAAAIQVHAMNKNNGLVGDERHNFHDLRFMFFVHSGYT